MVIYFLPFFLREARRCCLVRRRSFCRMVLRQHALLCSQRALAGGLASRFSRHHLVYSTAGGGGASWRFGRHCSRCFRVDPQRPAQGSSLGLLRVTNVDISVGNMLRLERSFTMRTAAIYFEDLSRNRSPEHAAKIVHEARNVRHRCPAYPASASKWRHYARIGTLDCGKSSSVDHQLTTMY